MTNLTEQNEFQGMFSLQNEPRPLSKKFKLFIALLLSVPTAILSGEVGESLLNYLDQDQEKVVSNTPEELDVPGIVSIPVAHEVGATQKP